MIVGWGSVMRALGVLSSMRRWRREVDESAAFRQFESCCLVESYGENGAPRCRDFPISVA